MGEGGRVVSSREVHEHQPRDARVLERARQVSRLVVREMPERASDAAFQVRGIEAGLEQAFAVIRF